MRRKVAFELPFIQGKEVAELHRKILLQIIDSSLLAPPHSSAPGASPLDSLSVAMINTFAAANTAIVIRCQSPQKLSFRYVPSAASPRGIGVYLSSPGRVSGCGSRIIATIPVAIRSVFLCY
ncbi:hypothetical protein SLEP1_g48109 [Rubroshorea leprosula]|uniref:Uncharacterized protein n=1 Tax=Rubroshorea leprosula TaxID=152421 RepID=A0AAV5LSK9_9ROSI|nr:hypothetical protein SLEP1_g48109 [Rubroshorea leprosula]